MLLTSHKGIDCFYRRLHLILSKLIGFEVLQPLFQIVRVIETVALLVGF